MARRWRWCSTGSPRTPWSRCAATCSSASGRTGCRPCRCSSFPDAGPHEGLLPEASVAPVRRWLTVLAGADRAQGVIARTQRGSLAALRPWVDELADAVQAQVDARVAIEAELDEVLAGPADRVAAEVGRGGGRRRGRCAAPGLRTPGAAARSAAPGAPDGRPRPGPPRWRRSARSCWGRRGSPLVAARRAGERAVAAELGERLAAIELPDEPPGAASPDAEAQAWLDAASARVEGLGGHDAKAAARGRAPAQAGRDVRSRRGGRRRVAGRGGRAGPRRARPGRGARAER